EQFYSAAWNPCISVSGDATDINRVTYEVDLTKLNECILHLAVGTLMKILVEFDFVEPVSEDPALWVESCATERAALLERLQAVESAKIELVEVLPAPV